jgi:hypothetical protein
VTAAKAAERRRSRFVNILDIPSSLRLVLKRVRDFRRGRFGPLCKIRHLAAGCPLLPHRRQFTALRNLLAIRS